jgi:hypothetical protein
VQTLADGRKVPLIKSEDVLIDIDRNDIKIQIHGNIFADFADLITPFIKGIVIDEIESTVTSILVNDLPAVVNLAMEALDGYFPVPLIDFWWIDWETPEAAIVTDSTFEIGVKGLMFDSQFGEEEPSIAIPTMPYHDIYKTQEYQAYVSAYSIDGFFNSFLEAVGIHGWVNQTALPEDLQSVLTTGTINILLPGISDFYGSDQPVDIKFNVTYLNGFQVSQANTEMSGVLSLELEFWVTKSDGTREMACDLLLNQITFGFTALINNMDISLNITQIQVETVEVVSDTFGRLSASFIKTKINTSFAIALPIINRVLADHQIKFPSNILGLFELSDLTLDYYDDYIYAGATPTFIEPSAHLFTQ